MDKCYKHRVHAAIIFSDAEESIKITPIDLQYEHYSWNGVLSADRFIKFTSIQYILLKNKKKTNVNYRISRRHETGQAFRLRLFPAYPKKNKSYGRH